MLVFAKMKEDGMDPVLFGLTDDDFQLLSHSHNQLKREECKKCKETNVRRDKVKWDNNVGCAGCPLAHPELYRGGGLTKVSL